MIIICLNSGFWGWLSIESQPHNPENFHPIIFHGDRSWNNLYSHTPPSADIRGAVVSYKWKNVHKVLVNRLVKHAQENVARWTDHLDMTIAVDWDLNLKTKQIKKL